MKHSMPQFMPRFNAVIGGVQYNCFLHSVPYDEHKDGHAARSPNLPAHFDPDGFWVKVGLFVNTINPEIGLTYCVVR